jgi:hypothetical protein
MSDVVVNIPGFISNPEIGEAVRVEGDPDTKQKIINEIMDNTFFISTTDLVNQGQDHKAVINAEGVVGLSELNNPELQDTYREILQTDQDWPFGRGQLLETGDYVREIHLDTKAPDGTVKSITSTAVFDENGRLKFEPLMYFTPTEVFVGGSHHILEVKNILGWSVVHADIAATAQSMDKCTITTPQDGIAFTNYHTLPAWNVTVVELSQLINASGPCQTDPSLELQCANAIVKVAYSSFFPNWKIQGPTNVEVTKGDLPMSTGRTTIYDITCADGRKEVAATTQDSGNAGSGNAGSGNAGSGNAGIFGPVQDFFDRLF